MQNMSREDLTALLTDMRDRVASGDSYEGNIQYLIADDGHPYNVAAAYRVGNTMGQGGMVLVGTSTREIVEGPAQCACGDTAGPFVPGTPVRCEDCAGGGQ